MNGFIKSCALVLAACLLAGCASAPDLPPQPTLDELLAETNAAHQAVTKPQVDASQYRTRPAPDEETVDYFTGGGQTTFDPDAVVTAAQAAEDMEYLFDAFRTLYGPYDFFGGDETFGRHKAELQARLEEKESWTAAEVQDLLLEGLRFFEDGHFAVNGQRPNPWKVPFFFRESAFYRMEDGYIREDGKRVASVDGYEDLDELFKRSISPEGEIVYYPILLEEDGLQAGDMTLTIHYTDGSAQTLTAEPFVRYKEQIEGDAITEYHKDGEIPVFTIDSCYDGAMDEIVAGAIMVARYPVGIVDLRANLGGSDSVANTWLRQYTYTDTERPMYRNQYLMNVFSGGSGAEDGWIENDRVLIVLTSKNIASAAETFVDMAHNVENVLFIGENTWGAQVASAAYHVQLPNSGCVVTMGHGLFEVPQDWDYYEELRGYQPDLWVPAGEAEELAVKLMENLGAVQAEGEASSPAA